MMAQSITTSRLPDVPVEDANAEVAMAQSLVNTITMNRLTRKLQDSPAADLGQLLSQLASTYPQLRDTFVQAAKKRPSQPAQSAPSPMAARPGTKDGHRLDNLFVSGSSTEIILPLSAELRQLLFGAETSASTEEQPLDSGRLSSELDRVIRGSELLWNLHSTFVLALSPCVVVKIRPSDGVDEGANLLFLESAAPKEVLAPYCLGCVKSRHLTYLFMKRIEGETLEKVWPLLTSRQKSSVQAQLNKMLTALRSSQLAAGTHPGGNLGSFGSAHCKDMRRSVRVAPTSIANETGLNEFLCSDPQRSSTPWIKMVRGFMRNDHRIVMTHGDLHPRNIMVKWEGLADQETAEDLQLSHHERRLTVTGIIDWEMSGWYPEYWEYVKALATVDMKGPLVDWCEFLPTDAIGEWPVEFSIDLLISRWLG
ncbi:hypothetical protein GGS24DRAFT_62155 [Hypoxylon argillaceum]|nr:hypothetical protein GGS24DRAFT_62155 [Hypoxylon argillaceum]